MAQRSHLQHSNSKISLTHYLDSPISRRWRTYFKLIDLYKKNECLWMENHKDFFNFALKEKIWEKIANEMICPKYPSPQPEIWKQLVIKWRYKVQLEQLHEQEAKYLNTSDELPPKLRYSDQFKFLLKHMFDRKKPTVKRVVHVSPSETESIKEASLAARCMRLGRMKSRYGISFTQKLKKLEHMRNRQRSTLSLTPKALHQLL